MFTPVSNPLKEIVNYHYEGIATIDEVDVDRFKEGLASHNAKVQSVAARYFLENVSEGDEAEEACLVVTGSDGRDEKINGTASPLELILVIGRSSENQNKLIEKIRHFLSNNSGIFHKNLDIKRLETDRCSTFVRTVKKDEVEERSFPTRAIDAKYLVGNRKIYVEYKKKMYREQQDVEVQKLFKKFINSAVKPNLSLLRKCCNGTDKSHVDIDNGTLHFKEEGKKAVKATKYPFLRTIQYKIAEYLCKKIEEGKISEEEFLALPSSTVERIEWLATKGLIKLSEEELNKGKKAYTVSLHWFGIAQKEYIENGQSEIKILTEEIRQISREILNLCEKFK